MTARGWTLSRNAHGARRELPAGPFSAPPSLNRRAVERRAL